MTQKEKLIEILSKRICRSADILNGSIDGVSYKEILADFLIENGVTVQPCELAQENDALKQKVAALCKERDDVMRALDQTTVKLNDETARADALQRRCDDLEKSRQAWVRKCEALTGQLQDTMEEREKLKGLADEYLRAYYRLDAKHDELIRHPWRNLWRHIKEVLGIA